MQPILLSHLTFLIQHSAPSIRAAAARARMRGTRPGAAVRAPTDLAWSPCSSPPQRERVKARGGRSAPLMANGEIVGNRSVARARRKRRSVAEPA